jgi:hypothetical protein
MMAEWMVEGRQLGQEGHLKVDVLSHLALPPGPFQMRRRPDQRQHADVLVLGVACLLFLLKESRVAITCGDC